VYVSVAQFYHKPRRICV